MWYFTSVIGALSIILTVWGIYMVRRESTKKPEERPEIHPVQPAGPIGSTPLDLEDPGFDATGPVSSGETSKRADTPDTSVRPPQNASA